MLRGILEYLTIFFGIGALVFVFVGVNSRPVNNLIIVIACLLLAAVSGIVAKRLKG